MLTESLTKNNLIILSLALAAGLLISLCNLSVIVILLGLACLWFALERFEDALLLLILYLPFQVALNVAAGFDVASGRVLILLFFAIWIVRSLKNKKINIDFSLQTLLITLFLLAATFSWGQVFETDRAIRKLLVLFTAFPLYFVLTSFAGDRKFIGRAVRYLLVAGCIIAFIGIAQFLAQFVLGINPLFDFFSKIIAPIFYGNTFAAEVVANPSWLVNVGGVTLLRSFAIFSDPHIFSFYLGLIVPLAFALIFLDKKELANAAGFRGRTFVISAFVMLIVAELLTFSRGGYVGMAASFFVMIILFWKHFAWKQKKIFFALFLSGIIFVTSVNNSILTRFLSSFDMQEGSNTERIKNWQQGWDTFSGNVWTGVGIGNYSFYLDPTTAYRTPIYAHNLYLDLGAELGVLALLIWILLVGITIYELYLASKRTHDKALSNLSLGLIGSLVWYSAHSFFDTSIYAPNILAMLVVIIALSVSAIRCVKMEER